MKNFRLRNLKIYNAEVDNKDLIIDGINELDIIINDNYNDFLQKEICMEFNIGSMLEKSKEYLVVYANPNLKNNPYVFILKNTENGRIILKETTLNSFQSLSNLDKRKEINRKLHIGFENLPKHAFFSIEQIKDARNLAKEYDNTFLPQERRDTMAIEKANFSALNAIKEEVRQTKSEAKVRDADGNLLHKNREVKEEPEASWDGMDECEEDFELTSERVFEETHSSGNGKDSLGERSLEKGKEKAKEKKPPEMEAYVRHREDQLLAMSGGNTLHYQTEAIGNMTGQNYMDDSVQVVTEDIHKEREFSMNDDVVSDAFDLEEMEVEESIDDIKLDRKQDDVVYIYADEESDKMAFPSLDDEPSFSGEKELKSPWSN